MKTREYYCCEYCDKYFYSEEKCEEHEKSHIKDYSNAPDSEISKELKMLSDRGYGYRFGNSVLGIPIKNFESILDTAAKRLEGGK